MSSVIASVITSLPGFPLYGAGVTLAVPEPVLNGVPCLDVCLVSDWELDRDEVLVWSSKYRYGDTFALCASVMWACTCANSVSICCIFLKFASSCFFISSLPQCAFVPLFLVFPLSSVALIVCVNASEVMYACAIDCRSTVTVVANNLSLASCCSATSRDALSRLDLA